MSYKKYLFSIVICFVIIICSQLSEISLAAATPESFIRDLYKNYLIQYDKEYWFDNEYKLLVYFDKNMTKLFLNDEKCKEETGEVCNLNFDPIISAQDLDNKYGVNYEIKMVDSDSTTIRCQVIFTNITTRTLIFELKKIENEFKIIDIIYSSGQSLKTILSQE